MKSTVNKTERIKVLNKDIKSHFNNAKALKVRRSIQPGNKNDDLMTALVAVSNVPLHPAIIKTSLMLVHHSFNI